MSGLALIAAKGSPGVTTLGYAMTLARAADGAVLVEADAHGGDLALMHGVSQTPGLAELAARARHSGGLDLLDPHIRLLAAGALPVVLAPVDGAAVRAALNVMIDHPGPLDVHGHGRTLIFDLGRAEPDSPGWLWLNACDQVLLVARTDLTGLAHAATLAQRLRTGDTPAALALIDTGPYPPDEAEAVLGLPLAGILPFHPKPARALLDRDRVHTAASSPLATSAGEIFDAVERRKLEVPLP